MHTPGTWVATHTHLVVSDSEACGQVRLQKVGLHHIVLPDAHGPHARGFGQRGRGTLHRRGERGGRKRVEGGGGSGIEDAGGGGGVGGVDGVLTHAHAAHAGAAGLGPQLQSQQALLLLQHRDAHLQNGDGLHLLFKVAHALQRNGHGLADGRQRGFADGGGGGHG